jgi:hypothetical protein
LQRIVVRVFRPASMPASASSRHCSSSAIVTPTSRDTASTGSPRSNRRTTPRLRPVDQRFPSHRTRLCSRRDALTHTCGLAERPRRPREEVEDPRG